MANAAGQHRESDAQFVARMESQCFQIQRYRWHARLVEGRALSEDEAAREWIQRYAANFAQTGAGIDSA
ncbi:MAG: hypothetical protein H6988_10225 [Pseudomonadales bacterium]|nr:hypothetical protein [Halieaceae bacterium]MCP5164164.1 hypothetical protein [Pseudomonadales bacterium]MCP5190752.1 hypothetical protein [Pseudomonadales bacterium]MCP5203760.1 hypothetical protein [Pseudomonadales bacterium]